MFIIADDDFVLVLVPVIVVVVDELFLFDADRTSSSSATDFGRRAIEGGIKSEHRRE
jgi:hypothetical protein